MMGEAQNFILLQHRYTLPVYPDREVYPIVASIVCTDLIPLKSRGLYQGLGNMWVFLISDVHNVSMLNTCNDLRSIYGLGAGLGGPLGGFINDRLGWRWAFLCQVRGRSRHSGVAEELTFLGIDFQVPLLALSLVLALVYVNVNLPEERQTAREKLARIDYFGSLTLVAGIGSLLVAVTLKGSEELPWHHPLVWTLLVSSIVFIAGFVIVEGFFSKELIVPLRLLKQRTPRAVALMNLCVLGFWGSWLATQRRLRPVAARCLLPRTRL